MRLPARHTSRRRLVSAADDGARGAVESRLAALERRVEQAEQQAAARHRELLDALTAWERRTRRDVMTAMEKQAAASSAGLLRDHMHEAALFANPQDTLRHAVEQVAVDGMALEFGVATGATLRRIAQTHGRGPVFGFDSFQGLPETWRTGYPRGEFAQDEVPRVSGAELVVGWFDATLPGFLADHPDTVAFLHLDADLYSSTRTVLDLVGPRLAAGSVVLFDEYYNYAGWQEHEYRAWQEHVERTGVEWEYLGLTMDDEQVSVRVTGVRG